jgi:crotonobetainyl-CoA:carnitine CoA-transferase CaiB-like acyl-CoA transferase
VVGLEQYMSGPYCTMVLADAGAEVIKIERPGTGDPRRSIPPFAEGPGGRKAAGFMAYNRNKKSLALDLRSPEGQEILRDLVATADVVVENLRPGAMDKLGFGSHDLLELNPRIITATISGFGRLPGYETHYAGRPAFDIVAEAMAGIMDLVGFEDRPPTYTIYGLADIYTGLATANAITQALFLRERTGLGQQVDVSLLDAMVSLNERMVALYSVTGQPGIRGRLRHAWPRGAFACADGYVALNVPDDLMWRRLVETAGRPDLADHPLARTGTDRASNADTLRPMIEAWMADKTREEVVDALNAAGMPAAPVYTAEDVFEDPHFRDRGSLVEILDPVAGAHVFARTPGHLAQAPEIPRRPAPALGEHTREVLAALGRRPDEIQWFVERGVVEAPGGNGG